MRPNPLFASEDEEDVRRLVRENPWAILVSSGANGVVASHYPVLLDEDTDELALLTHLGKPDDRMHELTRGELLVIVQGRHGYISPSWYPPGPGRVPTWNFSVAHLYGEPQLLTEEENLRVLTRLVDHFERRVEDPAHLDPEEGARIAKGTVGLRMRVTRFICKRKLSQNKDEATRRNVVQALREPGPYRHPELADEVEEAQDR